MSAYNPLSSMRTCPTAQPWDMANSIAETFPAMTVPAHLSAAPARAFSEAESVRRMAVIDPFSDGHHFPWLVDFCLAFLEAGMEVTALCPDPDRLRAEVLRQSATTGGVAFDAVSSEGMIRACDRFAPGLQFYQACRNWSRTRQRLDALPPRLRPDAVFFAYIDGMLARGVPPFLVNRLFPYRWSALYMSPTWLRLGRRLWPALETSVAWCLQAENCESVAVLDEGMADRLGGLLPEKPIVQLPDFLPGTAEAVRPGINETIRERARGRCVVGVVGSLQSRKGITGLLRLALEEPDGPYFYVFAGKFVPNGFPTEERALWQAVIAAPPENCYIRPDAIESEEAYVAVANSCDIFYAAYLRFPNSSNALAWAAWLRKPIVVSDGFLMGERVRRYSLGAAVPENNRHACRAAFDEIRQRLEQDDLCEFGFARYLHDHSRTQLALGVRRLLHIYRP